MNYENREITFLLTQAYSIKLGKYYYKNFIVFIITVIDKNLLSS